MKKSALALALLCAAWLVASPARAQTAEVVASCNGLALPLHAQWRLYQDQNGGLCLGAANGSVALGLTNGWTPLVANALSTTVKAVKSSAGQIGMVQCFNPNSTQVYIQAFNLASGSVVLGTTPPAMSLPIAPNATGGFALSNPGVNFSVAMSVAATTTATGAGAPSTAPDCNLAYH